jgi:hypothetical protein
VDEVTSHVSGPECLEGGTRPLEATFAPDGDPPTREQGKLRVYGDRSWPWPIRRWLSQDDDALVEDGAVEELTAFLTAVGPDWDLHAVGSTGTAIKAWGSDEKLAMLCWLVCAVSSQSHGSDSAHADSLTELAT